MTTTFADNNGAKIAYETLGDPSNASIIFISGLGSQMVYWTDALCQVFIDRGFQIIRFDNRDVGLSHKTAGEPPTVAAMMNGERPNIPYSLSTMAADTVAVLDAVGVAAAHVVGVSLGGMIAQTMALEHPARVRTLTSIMSAPSRETAVSESSGNSEQDAAVAASLAVDLSDPNTYVDLQVEGYRVTSGPHFDAAYQRAIIQESFDRCYHPAGWSYQMMAATASGDRLPLLTDLTVPTLVIHGKLDPLISWRSGKLTADAIPGATWLLIEDMGHNLPRPRWGDIADALVVLASER